MASCCDAPKLTRTKGRGRDEFRVKDGCHRTASGTASFSVQSLSCLSKAGCLSVFAPNRKNTLELYFFMAAVILPMFALLEIPRPSHLFVLVDGGRSVWALWLFNRQEKKNEDLLCDLFSLQCFSGPLIQSIASLDTWRFKLLLIRWNLIIYL